MSDSSLPHVWLDKLEIRDVIEDELEQVFSGKRSAKAALDHAVERGNRLLRQFERANPDR